MAAASLRQLLFRQRRLGQVVRCNADPGPAREQKKAGMVQRTFSRVFKRRNHKNISKFQLATGMIRGLRCHRR